MIPSPQAIIDALSDPQALHATLVHFPIAFSALGVVLMLALMLTAGKSVALRWWTVLMYLAGAGLAYWAAEVGEAAYAEIDTLALAATAEHTIEALAHHRRLGEWAWIPMLVTAVLAALTGFKKPTTRGGFLAVAFLAALLNVGYIGATAYHGGELVYEHGAGVPTSPANVNPPVMPTRPATQIEPVPATQPAEREPAEPEPAESAPDPAATPPQTQPAPPASP